MSHLSNRNSAASNPVAANSPAEPVWVDLLAQIGAQLNGPQWAHECDDLDMTLLSWKNGHRLEEHVNSEVDGILIGVEGAGVVTVNGKAHELRPGVMLLVPKGCARAIESTSERFSYLSVHRRRRGLMPTNNLKPTNSLAKETF